MHLSWWQTGIIYEVYARSLQDSDGDGMGDLRGITRRLDHFVWLGVNAIWITPVFPSPMTDSGYDVADYCGIDPLFGALDDFDKLVREAHARGLKIILDYVPNHTSDQHPWFLESRRSRASRTRNWYLWRDAGPEGGPPNNWLSNFNGSAWTWDAGSRQYYYHSFLPTQPDLNWRHPEVRSAMHDVLRFWLRRGVDGFRVDVMWMMIKDDQYRDNPPNPDWRPGAPSHDRLLPLYTSDRPEVHEVVAGLRAVLGEFEDRVLIGEIYLPVDRLVAYYGAGLRGAQLPFNFQLLLLEGWSAVSLARTINTYMAALPPGGSPSWVLGNHDRSRVATRVGSAQARIAAMLLLTLRGTPTIYMGDELGMLDTPIPPGQLRDPAELREPGRGLGRDPERTPFPWHDGPGAGFTEGTPWLPVGRDVSLQTQRESRSSMVSFYRRLIQLRHTLPALRTGSMTQAIAEGGVLSYRRGTAEDTLLVTLNTTDMASRPVAVTGRVLASTNSARESTLVKGYLILDPNEGVIVAVDNTGRLPADERPN